MGENTTPIGLLEHLKIDDCFTGFFFAVLEVRGGGDSGSVSPFTDGLQNGKLKFNLINRCKEIFSNTVFRIKVH